MQPGGVAHEPAAGVVQLPEGGVEPLPVRVHDMVQCQADLLPHGRGLAGLVVQVEGEHAHSNLVQALLHHVQCGALLGDEENPLSLGDRPGQEVRDGLGLSGAGRAFQDERPLRDRFGNGLQLGGIRRDRGARGKLVEVDVGNSRHGIHEGLRGGVDEVIHQGVRGQQFPVLVEVLPEPELGELQDGQVDSGLHAEGQVLLGDGPPDGVERSVEVDA